MGFSLVMHACMQVPLGGGALGVVTVMGDGLFRFERRPAWGPHDGDQRATFNVINRRVSTAGFAFNHSLSPLADGGHRLVVASESAEIVVDANGGGEFDGHVTFACDAAGARARGSGESSTSSWVSTRKTHTHVHSHSLPLTSSLHFPSKVSFKNGS